MIQSQAELIQRLTLQLRSTEEGYMMAQEDCANLKQNMSQVSTDLTTSQADLKEVLQALEELALSYDSKDKEIEQSISAKVMLQGEVEKLQVSVRGMGGCGQSVSGCGQSVSGLLSGRGMDWSKCEWAAEWAWHGCGRSVSGLKRASLYIYGALLLQFYDSFIKNCHPRVYHACTVAGLYCSTRPTLVTMLYR